MHAIPRSWKRYLFVLWGLDSIPILIVVILFFLLANGWLGYVPTFENLENPRSNIASEIWSTDSVLLGTFYLENRISVDFTELLEKSEALTTPGRFQLTTQMY